jgi:hypothetical protein
MEYFTPHKFVVPVTKDVVARGWRERGYSCNWFVDPPGQQWNNSDSNGFCGQRC